MNVWTCVKISYTGCFARYTRLHSCVQRFYVRIRLSSGSCSVGIRVDNEAWRLPRENSDSFIASGQSWHRTANVCSLNRCISESAFVHNPVVLLPGCLKKCDILRFLRVRLKKNPQQARCSQDLCCASTLFTSPGSVRTVTNDETEGHHVKFRECCPWAQTQRCSADICSGIGIHECVFEQNRFALF